MHRSVWRNGFLDSTAVLRARAKVTRQRSGVIAPLPAWPATATQRTGGGETWVDPFAYLEKMDPEAATSPESKYFASWKQSRLSEIKQLSRWLAAHEPTIPAVPESDAHYTYFYETPRNATFPVFSRRRKYEPKGRNEVVLDLNTVVRPDEFRHVSMMKFTHDQHMMAFALDRTGDERYDVHFKSFTKEKAPSLIKGAYGVQWAAGRKLLYTVQDHLKRPYQAYMRDYGTTDGKDVLLYEESDPQFFIDVSATKDKELITICSSSKVATEVRVAPATDPTKLTVVRPRDRHRRYYVEHHAGRLVVITERGNDGHQVELMPIVTALKESTTLLSSDRGVVVEDADVFVHHLALYERIGIQQRIRIVDIPSWNSHFVDLPKDAMVVSPASNMDFHTTELLFSTGSPINPGTVYAYDMKSRVLTERATATLPGNDCRLSDLRVETINVTLPSSEKERDATIPIVITRHKNTQYDGSAPLLLDAYGAYGKFNAPGYVHRHLSLLEKGWILATAHVRGARAVPDASGSTTVRDLHACAQHLNKERFVHPDKLCGEAVSAGALAFGVLMAKEPTLFRALVLHVPYLDHVTTMTNPALPLTEHEYDEWGNPNDPGVLAQQRAMCAYSLIPAQAPTRLPDVLVTVGMKDSRVPYWGPLKWVTRWRDAIRNRSTSGSDRTATEPLILMDIRHDIGHFEDNGPAACEASARDQIFLTESVNRVR